MSLMFLAPRNQPFSSILINSAWAFIAWIIWSIIIVVLTFFASNAFEIVDITNSFWRKISPIFPFILSIITLLWTTITSFLTYHILNMTDPEKYKKNRILFGQLAFLQILAYILMTPLYIYTWVWDFQNIIYVYLFHILLIISGTNIILDIFNNYRYVLIWIYGTIIALYFGIVFSVFVFSNLWDWAAKMVILMALLPLSNFIITFLKQIFELLYYYYYKFTSLDPLWDIFYQVEVEEERKLREEEEKNTI